MLLLRFSVDWWRGTIGIIAFRLEFPVVAAVAWLVLISALVLYVANVAMAVHEKFILGSLLTVPPSLAETADSATTGQPLASSR